MPHRRIVVWSRTAALFLALPLLLAAGCAPGGEATADPAEEAAVREEVAARMEGMRDALLRGEPDEFMDYWTSDLHIREPGMDLDRAGFETFVRDFFAAGQVLELDIRPAETFVHDDAAYEYGEYDETIQEEGQDPVTLRNHYVARWERGEDGAWRIDRFVAGPREAPEGM